MVPAIEMRGIVKRFGNLTANAGVDLEVARGEVHALLGENGAGKSTLMNILYGLIRPDAGELRIHGRPVRFRTARDAVAAGLGMVHQHFMLIPGLTVTENVILGAEGDSSLYLNRQAAARRVAELCDQYGLQVDPGARIADLPVGLQQRVEILKALYRGSDILILDEPTALLTPQEVEELYRVLERLRTAGRTVVFITHKLHEVKTISDRVTVIRQGRTVGTRRSAECSREELAEWMVGRSVSLRVERPVLAPGEPLLEVEGLVVGGRGPRPAVAEVSFQVRSHEIVGICGVEGNGQTELAEALAGMRPARAGRIRLLGRELIGAQVVGYRRAGICHIPADRHHHGLVLDFSLTENVLLGNHEDPPFVRGLHVDYRAAEQVTRQIIQQLGVRAPGPGAPARALSGGNQQKLIVGRELWRRPRVLLAAQPTRGLDVGAVEAVHRLLLEQRNQGGGILLVSLDLDEILELSDRILVLFEGRIVGQFQNGAVSRAELGLLMSGAGTREVDHATAH